MRRMAKAWEPAVEAPHQASAERRAVVLLVEHFSSDTAADCIPNLGHRQKAHRRNGHRLVNQEVAPREEPILRGAVDLGDELLRSGDVGSAGVVLVEAPVLPEVQLDVGTVVIAQFVVERLQVVPVRVGS